ncbi:MULTISPECIES: hypothetical protein [unclassified Cedecea]|uniref:hypothetical protein n=1 Tax=unclassified Cedecea TaxID=2649846 RepID=UPI003016ED49
MLKITSARGVETWFSRATSPKASWPVKPVFIIYDVAFEHITPTYFRHSFPGVMIFLIIQNNNENNPGMML